MEHKWSKRAGSVTTCETPSHHVRRPAGAGRRNRPTAARAAPDGSPTNPAAPPTRPEATRAGHHDQPRAPTPSTSPRTAPGKVIQGVVEDVEREYGGDYLLE